MVRVDLVLFMPGRHQDHGPEPAKLHADGVRVDEIEQYHDLGQSGPSIGAFAKTLAGAQYTNPAWTFGVSPAALTRTYDPES